jgi:hypothetical protein
MAGGILIQYERKLSVPTADINMVKLHWNSIVSMALAKYMYNAIKIVYLSAALESTMNIQRSLLPCSQIE